MGKDGRTCVGALLLCRHERGKRGLNICSANGAGSLISDSLLLTGPLNMASYFSNLSSTSTQSRFLSNKDRDSSSVSTDSHNPPSRVPSKHFSTTLSDEQKGATLNEKSPTTNTSVGLPA